MFKKPFKIRGQNAIRGSDRKKVRSSLSTQFPNLSPEALLEIVPQKEDMTVMKITTFDGSPITCYCVLNNPILFEWDTGKLLPSVYLLWKIQVNMLWFQTHRNVFERIQDGADLLMAGVTGAGGMTSFPVNQPCFITLSGNDAAVAIGRTLFSSDELQKDGVQNKRVKIYHAYKDFLWSSGEKCEPPLITRKDEETQELESQEVEDNAEEVDTGFSNELNNEIENDENKDSSTQCTDIDPTKDENIDNRTDDDSLLENDSETKEPELSNLKIEDGDDIKEDTIEDPVDLKESMDNLLMNCFHQALLNMKKVPLPLLVSNFSSLYLHAACPEGSRIDIKKSSFKKISKFLDEMQCRNLVKVAELSPGVASITSINYENDSFRIFRQSSFAQLVRTQKEEERVALSNKPPPEKLSIQPMYSISAKLVPLFKLFELNKGSLVSGEDVRRIVTDYVSSNQLTATDKKRVILDPILSDAISEKHALDIPWNELMKRLCEQMNPCHKINIPGKPPQIRKGNPQNIEITTQQAMGNKMLTQVDNLELFGIDAKTFANELRQKSASSTTVNSIGKTEKLQVQVQGNQTKHDLKLLGNYDIPTRYITEKGSKSKKSGKSK
jgi:translation initiation factor 2D